MPKFAIATITADRSPSRNYIIDTVKNFQRGGVYDSEFFHSHTIFDDGSSIEFVNELQEFLQHTPAKLIHFEERLNSRKNAMRAHKHLWELRNEIDWGITTEDDIDVCTRFLESVNAWLTDFETPDRYIYMLGLPRGISASNSKQYNDVARVFHGSQGYVMRPKYYESSYKYLENLPNGKGHDLMIAKWIRDTYDKKHHFFRAAAPALIQHIGEESLTNPKRQDKIKFDFIGQDRKYYKK